MLRLADTKRKRAYWRVRLDTFDLILQVFLLVLPPKQLSPMTVEVIVFLFGGLLLVMFSHFLLLNFPGANFYFPGVYFWLPLKSAWTL